MLKWLREREVRRIRGFGYARMKCKEKNKKRVFLQPSEGILMKTGKNTLPCICAFGREQQID